MKAAAVVLLMSLILAGAAAQEAKVVVVSEDNWEEDELQQLLDKAKEQMDQGSATAPLEAADLMKMDVLQGVEVVEDIWDLDAAVEDLQDQNLEAEQVEEASGKPLHAREETESQPDNLEPDLAVASEKEAQVQLESNQEISQNQNEPSDAGRLSSEEYTLQFQLDQQEQLRIQEEETKLLEQKKIEEEIQRQLELQRAEEEKKLQEQLRIQEEARLREESLKQQEEEARRIAEQQERVYLEQLKAQQQQDQLEAERTRKEEEERILEEQRQRQRILEQEQEQNRILAEEIRRKEEELQKQQESKESDITGSETPSLPQEEEIVVDIPLSPQIEKIEENQKNLDDHAFSFKEPSNYPQGTTDCHDAPSSFPDSAVENTYTDPPQASWSIPWLQNVHSQIRNIQNEYCFGYPLVEYGASAYVALLLIAYVFSWIGSTNSKPPCVYKVIKVDDQRPAFQQEGQNASFSLNPTNSTDLQEALQKIAEQQSQIQSLTQQVEALKNGQKQLSQRLVPLCEIINDLQKKMFEIYEKKSSLKKTESSVVKTNKSLNDSKEELKDSARLTQKPSEDLRASQVSTKRQPPAQAKPQQSEELTGPKKQQDQPDRFSAENCFDSLQQDQFTNAQQEDNQATLTQPQLQQSQSQQQQQQQQQHEQILQPPPQYPKGRQTESETAVQTNPFAQGPINAKTTIPATQSTTGAQQSPFQQAQQRAPEQSAATENKAASQNPPQQEIKTQTSPFEPPPRPQVPARTLTPRRLPPTNARTGQL